jgi:hypothetical protein
LDSSSLEGRLSQHTVPVRHHSEGVSRSRMIGPALLLLLLLLS